MKNGGSPNEKVFGPSLLSLADIRFLSDLVAPIAAKGLPMAAGIQESLDKIILRISSAERGGEDVAVRITISRSFMDGIPLEHNTHEDADIAALNLNDPEPQLDTQASHQADWTDY